MRLSAVNKGAYRQDAREIDAQTTPHAAARGSVGLGSAEGSTERRAVACRVSFGTGSDGCT